jgi:hypothetical protein
MAEAVRFKISPTVAAFVRPGVPSEKKLSGIQTASHLEPFERITLLFCLLKDVDPAVKELAGTAFFECTVDAVLAYIQAADAHPMVLNELAKVHCGKPEIVTALLGSGLLTIQAREFLQKHLVLPPQQTETFPSSQSDGDAGDGTRPDATVSSDDDLPCQDDDTQDENASETDEMIEESDEFLSKYKVAMIMGIGEKIKMALTGDKEWRAILVKDTNKLVSGSVIKNPRITDGEILTLVKVGIQNDEIMRLICANKEWIKNYMIRKALVCSPKTPLPNALRYLATLTEKDIAFFAKSKNVPSVVSTQAKRILLSKKR